MGFPRQEHWSGLPFPSPDPGIKPESSALQADSLPLSHLGNPLDTIIIVINSTKERETIMKTKIMTSGPITSWQKDGETMETDRLYLGGGAPKSLQMVIEAMKLKDTCSLEEKL